MPTTACALVAGADRTFSLEAIELGDPGDGEVLVRIDASGVCHTDVDLLNRGFLHAMGHEGAGQIISCGPGVEGLTVGDKVALNWAIPCKRCYQCTRDRFNLCEARPRIAAEKRTLSGKPIPASFGLATLASHTVVPAAAVVRLDIDIPPTSAALLGCCVMTGFGSATNVADIRPDTTVVVIGTGAVGLFVVQGAVHMGARTIVAVDIHPARLEIAMRLGATHCVQSSATDEGLLRAAGEVRKLLGRPADIAFECTAVPSLAASPLAMICNGGTAIAVSGFEEVVPIDMRLFEFDKTYINPLYGGCNPARDFPALLSCYRAGTLKIDDLVTKTYPLCSEGLALAIEAMQTGTGTKSVLIPEAR
jgi:S-(hydroxymethyl)glutathione dehydrogenase / alcohol dehydrogenase